MPTPKSLAGYPEYFWDVTENTLKKREEILGVESEGDGINIRRRWYTWRKILDEQGHPWGRECQGIMIRLKQNEEGKWFLYFNLMGGLTQETRERLKRVEPEKVIIPTSPVPLKTKVATSNPFESILQKYGYSALEEKKELREEEIPTTTCLHEFALGHCHKCGIPEPDEGE